MTDIAIDTPSVPEVDPLAGTAYRTVRLIGSGAMGQVFEAEHAGLRRRVAVKVLTPALAGDPAFVDRLRLEAQALAGVRHPNVVLVHDHATTPAGVPFLVMELLHGRTLHDLLRERTALPLLDALHLVDQVFAGLSAIHMAGLTHRDLKPANIFLSEEHGRTTIKLLDFGIVKVTRPDPATSIAPLRFPTELGHILGTPRFMAPEQITSGACDARTDVYAAGVLVFLLLAGRDPFHHHRTHIAILTAQVREKPPLLSTVASQPIPPRVDAAVARALAKDPADRFASIEDFGAALGAAAFGATSALLGAQTSTEKMPGGTWSRPPQETAPLSADAFRSIRNALPFAASRASAPAQATAPRRAPSFGLPPLAAGEIAVPARPMTAPLLWDRMTDAIDTVKAWSPLSRLLLAVVALLWGLVIAVAWRAL